MKNVAIIAKELNSGKEGEIIRRLLKELSIHYHVCLFLLSIDDISSIDHDCTLVNIGDEGPYYEYSIQINKLRYEIDCAISFSIPLHFANIRTKGKERVILAECDKNHPLLETKISQSFRAQNYYSFADDMISYEAEIQQWISAIENNSHKLFNFVAIQEEILKKANKIIIYGAGNIGKSCYLRLHKKYSIDSFVVSKKNNSKDSFLGVPIREINEFIGSPKNILILVALGEKYQDEVVQLLLKLGFDNFIFPYFAPLNYDYYMNCSQYDVQEELSNWYRLVMERDIDLYHPRTFNEKIQWLKLFDKNPQKTILADKYLVRNYIIEKIGEEYLIPLLGVWDRFDDIDFSCLPDKFILKCNHGSGTNAIITDKNQINFTRLEMKFNYWMKMNYAYKSGFEMHYANIIPKIIAEELLESKSGEQINDYKLMCFGGKVKCSFVCSDRFSEEGLKVTFYDSDWNIMPFERHYPRSTTPISKPINYEKMVELAEKLAEGLPFVRVDFYEVNGKIYFGELTFCPGSGVEEFTPDEWDLKLGEWIQLPGHEFD